MAGAYRTLEDLILETLANIGVLVAGQAPDPEDYDYVAEKADAIFRKLHAHEICYVPDPENIPGEWFADLADIFAGECCLKFGASDVTYQKLTNKGLGGVQGIDVGYGAAAKSLRLMNRGKPTREVLQSDFF